MTPAQSQRLYFPAWNDAFRANWHRAKGRITPRPGRPISAPGSDIPDANTVEQAATAVAAPHHRAPTADDLRHACHIIALGLDLSSKRLDNPQTTRVVTLFRLLADPEHISSVLDWLDSDRPRREWLVRQIHATGAPQAYIHDICTRRFAHEYDGQFHENLPLRSLEWLVRQIQGMAPQHPEWRAADQRKESEDRR